MLPSVPPWFLGRSRPRGRRPRGELEAVPAEGQRPYALAGRGEDRVCDRGDERDRTHLPRPSHRPGAAVDDVDLDGRRLVHLGDPEAVEVPLHGPAVPERDRRLERRSEAPDGPTLDRVAGDLRVE